MDSLQIEKGVVVKMSGCNDEYRNLLKVSQYLMRLSTTLSILSGYLSNPCFTCFITLSTPLFIHLSLTSFFDFLVFLSFLIPFYPSFFHQFLQSSYFLKFSRIPGMLLTWDWIYFISTSFQIILFLWTETLHSASFLINRNILNGHSIFLQTWEPGFK